MIKRIILSMFLLLVGAPFVVSADYTVFDLNPIPADTPVTDPNYAMAGFSNGTTWTIEYTADAMVTQFDRLTMPFCRSGGANGGVIDLEIRSSTTTGPIIASSTIDVNSGNVWNTGCSVGIINATTTTWVLNQNIQWLPGVTVYFVFHARGVTGTYYFSHFLDATIGELPTFATTDTYFKPGTDYYMTAGEAFALGIPPVVYNASSSNISCSTFDVGCYITTGLSLLFYPEDWTFEQLDELQAQLASTTPFGYGYELVETINMALNTATSSFALTADLSDFGPVFQNATSVPIVSSEGIIAFAGDDWDTVQTLLAGALYLILLSYFWFRFFNTI